jgi:Zn-finger nucleic acid-binding protein
LFDDGELTAIGKEGSDALRTAEKAFVPSIELSAPTGKGRRCPACNGLMSPYRYLYTTPIVLDECDKCHAIWVQEGELEMMANALERVAQETVDPQLRTLLTHQIAIAELEVKHHETHGKHRMFQRVMRTLSLRKSGYGF